MRPIDDPSFLTPEGRRSEVASILAAGILRLRARAALPESACPDLPPDEETRGSCLEVSDETGLQYNRARYYDATLGRWVSRDPIGFADDRGNLYRYLRNMPTVGTDPNGLQSLFPNWNQGAGELHHDFHSITFFVRGCEITEKMLAHLIQDDLEHFRHFNFGHNDQATVRVSGGIAYFDMLGVAGLLSDLINDPKVAVSLSTLGNEVSGQTLGDHQLVGVRKWRYAVDNVASGYAVTIETEAYDRPRIKADDYGAAIAGTEVQLAIWKAYLRNIADYYVNLYDGSILDQHASWQFLGYVANPWGPANQYVPPEGPLTCC
ncbi:MAG: RHS repeat-associated core domain-containing protein [Pirellulales bacterium]